MEEQKNYNHIEYKSGGLQCDNESCDYVNMDIKTEDYPNWVNEPCPKCGENLLTEDDYMRSVALEETIKLMNSLSPEEFEAIMTHQLTEEAVKNMKDSDFFKDAEGIDDIDENTTHVEFHVSTHKELKAVSIKAKNK